MTQPPTIGLVTVTYNSASVIKPFLACVSAQTVQNHLLVVVDNASRDDSLALVAAHGDARTLVIANADNLGVAEGNNQGIEACRARGIDWILLINNDTEFSPTLLEGVLASAAKLQARVIVPRVTYFDRPEQNWFAGGHFSWLRGFQARHEESPAAGSEREAPREIACAPTCCMLIHASIFDSVGLMDAAYFVYWDDTDFCWRLNRHHIPIMFEPAVSLAHKVSSLTGGAQTPFSARHYNRNQVYFLRKHFPPLVVHANILWIRLKNVARRALQLDDAAIADVRVKAIAEGLRMPLPPRAR